LTDADCDNIAAIATASGITRPFITKEALMEVTGITRTKYEAVSDFLTADGYIDQDTIDPQDITTPYKTQKRSPVNVNTASKEVLIAVLNGIKAVHSCPNCGGDGYLYSYNKDATHYPLRNPDCEYCDGTGGGYPNATVKGDMLITFDEATATATYIMEHRPYSNWSNFYSSMKTLCNGSPFTTTGHSSDPDLIMANANPNTDFCWAKNSGWGGKLGYVGKYIIDVDHSGTVTEDDKGLYTSTTEFSFNSGGYYSISSTGTVSDAAGNRLAQKRINTVVKVFDIWRQTTQAQFNAAASSDKVQVQTYPEPQAVTAAGYDGQIMVAKLPITTPSSGTAYFRAGYTTTLNADAVGGSGDATLKTPLTGSLPPTIASIAKMAPAGARGELLPDGMLVDVYDKVSANYLPSGKVLPAAGTIEIWFKPMWMSNDSMMYMDTAPNRKLFKITSNKNLDGTDTTTDLKLPFLTYLLFSDQKSLCSLGVSGNWRWGFVSSQAWDFQPSEWNDPHGDFARNYYSNSPDVWEGGKLGDWNIGEWHVLAVTWVEPPNGGKGGGTSPVYGVYDSSYPLKTYFDGAPVFVLDPNYHNLTYGGSGVQYNIMVGGEFSKWQTPAGGSLNEMSNCVIGSARIWDSALSNADLFTHYTDGVYYNNSSFTDYSAEYKSTTFNPGGTVDWGTITWTGAVPGGTTDDIIFSVDPGSGSFTGNWVNSTGAAPINARSNSLRYRIRFSTPKTVSSSTTTTDLLANGSFESGIGSWDVCWNPGHILSSTVPVPFPDGNGTRCAKIDWNAAATQTVDLDSEHDSETYKLKASAYVPTNGSGAWGCVVGYLWLDSSGKHIRNDGAIIDWNPDELSGQLEFAQAGVWATKTSLALSPPSAAVKAVIKFCTYGSTPPNPTYFDAISFTSSTSMATTTVVMDTPVVDDVSITYLPRTQILYSREY
jgi:hypothetical protein